MKEASRLHREPDYVSPAREELVSKSPDSQGFDTEAIEDRMEEIEGTLGSHREIKALIEKLHAAGADTHKVLNDLALQVVMQECRSRRDYWFWELRRKKRSYKSLAAKIGKTALEIKNTYCDGADHNALRGVPFLGRASSAVEKLPRELLSLMQVCATDLEVMARGLGRLCKFESPWIKRFPVEQLMGHLHCATGDINPHFRILAEILTAAYEACGIKPKPPTEESLKKTFTRHVLPRLKRLPSPTKPVHEKS
jgi:hypothetical protein